MSLDDITLSYEKIRESTRDFLASLALVDIDELPPNGYNYWAALTECCNEVDTILRRFEQTVDEYIYKSEFRERQDRVTLNPEFKKICSDFKRGLQGIEQVSNVDGVVHHERFNNKIG